MRYLMQSGWWKWLTMALVSYTIIGGFLLTAPRLPILNETVRNLHFHVPMWFGMIFLFTGSVIYAIKYLKSKNMEDDILSAVLVDTGIVFGVLGLISGMIWANFTWGEPWSNDPKQNASAIAMLIYFALVILRGSLSDEHQRARIGVSRLINCSFNLYFFHIGVNLLTNN